MLLRPTQTLALEKTSAAFTRVRRVLLNAHTAFGKSTLVGTMLSRTKKSVLYICPQEGLMERVISDLNSAGIRHGVIHGSRGALPNTYRVHVSMPKTIANRLNSLPNFDWIISDEAHLALSDTWSSVLEHYAKAWQLGMSGSPCRLDGKPLGKHYDEIIYGPSIRESTARGYLVPIRVFAPPPPSQVEFGATKKMSLDRAAEVLNTPAITGSAIGEMRKRAPERQAMVFTCNRKHSENVAQQFRDAGITAVSVDSTMGDRKERFRDFESKRVQVLVNVELATTGYDYPPVSLGIMLRDTDSLALALQIWGRFVRISPGKTDALIHDHVGMVMTHGLPDADREWTLEGRPMRTAALAVRQCGKCYAVFSPAPRCPSCGYVIPVSASARGSLQQRDGDLAEVTEADIAARRQADIKAALKTASSKADFLEVAARFGNKPGWGIKMFEIYGKYRRRAA